MNYEIVVFVFISQIIIQIIKDGIKKTKKTTQTKEPKLEDLTWLK